MGDPLDAWLGPEPTPPAKNGKGKALPKEKGKNGDRLDIAEAVAFMERGQMSAAQLALGLLGITHQARAILGSPLKEDALLLLIQEKAGHGANRHKIPLFTIKKVLQGCADLAEFVDQDALERVRAARRKAEKS